MYKPKYKCYICENAARYYHFDVISRKRDYKASILLCDRCYDIIKIFYESQDWICRRGDHKHDDEILNLPKPLEIEHYQVTLEKIRVFRLLFYSGGVLSMLLHEIIEIVCELLVNIVDDSYSNRTFMEDYTTATIADGAVIEKTNFVFHNPTSQSEKCILKDMKNVKN